LSTLDGKEYASCVGTHAPASFAVQRNGQSTRFSPTVGVNASDGSRGSVTFEVYGHGELFTATDVITGADPAQELDVDITGVDTLTLKVTNAGDGKGNDHGDWAAALVQCGDGSGGQGADDGSGDGSGSDA